MFDIDRSISIANWNELQLWMIPLTSRNNFDDALHIWWFFDTHKYNDLIVYFYNYFSKTIKYIFSSDS